MLFRFGLRADIRPISIVGRACCGCLKKVIKSRSLGGWVHLFSWGAHDLGRGAYDLGRGAEVLERGADDLERGCR